MIRKKIFFHGGAKALSSEGFFHMEKLYVNEIRSDGEVSTVGLFYSQAEAEKIVAMLRADPARAVYRYEIVEAIRHAWSDKQARRATLAQKE